LQFQFFELTFEIIAAVKKPQTHFIDNHNFKVMTKGLVTKKSSKKEPTKSLKEKRKEKKEKKSAK